MYPDNDNLTQEEQDFMCSLPIYVSVLIAGADGNIDKHEIKKAISLTSIKTQKARKELIDYFKRVNTDFEDKLKMTIANLPKDTKEREKILIEEIGKANDVFPKLDKNFTQKLYLSLKDIAKSIAEASGGVFGYMSVGYEESKLIDLKMIKDPSK